MKKFATPALAILALVAFGFSACTDNDPDPAPTDPRQIFAGIWSVTETETRLTYEVNIELDPLAQNGGVFIYNFANSGTSSVPAYAYVSGNTISLEVNQVIGDGWIINGSGTLSSSRITWPYTLNDGATLHYISAVFTRN
ncbi:MAG: hypothetical protein JXA23_09440 [Bacteroidales bacterium]|nr:hypothetical protein [Bacteroidales bacterium]